MADALPKDITDSVAIGNMKSIAEQPAMLSNLAYSNTVVNGNLSMQNSVANQQSQNEVGMSVTGKVINLLSTLGPLESKSCNEILTGNVMAEQISNLKATIEAFKQEQTAKKPVNPVIGPVNPVIGSVPGSKDNPLPPGTYHAKAESDIIITNADNVKATPTPSTPQTGQSTVAIKASS
jgi:killing trait domain-containing protein